MFWVKIQAVLVLAVAIALNLPETRGLKCYHCEFRTGSSNTTCLSPLASMTHEESPESTWRPLYRSASEIGDPWCAVSITYNDTCRFSPPEDKYVLYRGLWYPGKTTLEKDMKEIGGIPLPECNDFSKFPNFIHIRRQIDAFTTKKCDLYTHRCLCKKDWCNSAAVKEIK